jgi:hypothetical protein
MGWQRLEERRVLSGWARWNMERETERFVPGQHACLRRLIMRCGLSDGREPAFTGVGNTPASWPSTVLISMATRANEFGTSWHVGGSVIPTGR